MKKQSGNSLIESTETQIENINPGKRARKIVGSEESKQSPIIVPNAKGKMNADKRYLDFEMSNWMCPPSSTSFFRCASLLLKI